MKRSPVDLLEVALKRLLVFLVRPFIPQGPFVSLLYRERRFQFVGQSM